MTTSGAGGRQCGQARKEGDITIRFHATYSDLLRTPLRTGNPQSLGDALSQPSAHWRLRYGASCTHHLDSALDTLDWGGGLLCAICQFESQVSLPANGGWKCLSITPRRVRDLQAIPSSLRAASFSCVVDRQIPQVGRYPCPANLSTTSRRCPNPSNSQSGSSLARGYDGS